MMRFVVKKIIQEARKFLEQQPYDGAHDLSHHLRVRRYTREIARQITIPIDLEALEIAAMWHDVVVSQAKSIALNKRHRLVEETVVYLDKLLINLGVASNFRKKVIEAVRYHDSQVGKQVNNEGKVLYDADKLDTLTPARWYQLATDVDRGKISGWQLKLYLKLGVARLKQLGRKEYNFDYSRLRHDQKVKLLLKDQKVKNIAGKLGIDLEKILL